MDHTLSLCRMCSSVLALKLRLGVDFLLRLYRSSTLENWIREFKRFAPNISVSAYYADKNERPRVRQRLLETQRSQVQDGWEVLVTTYNLAQGDEKDRKFFRKINWVVSIDSLYLYSTNQDDYRHASLTKDTYSRTSSPRDINRLLKWKPGGACCSLVPLCKITCRS